MQLRHRPHGPTRSEHGKRAVRRLLRRLLRGLRIDGEHRQHGERDAAENQQTDGTARKGHDGKTLSKRRACSRIHMSVEACCMANSLVCQAKCTPTGLTHPSARHSMTNGKPDEAEDVSAHPVLPPPPAR